MTPATLLDLDTVQEEISTPIESSSVFDRAVCLSVELCRFGTKKKVKVSALRAQAQTDEQMIHVSKDLIVSKEFDAIKQHDGAIRRYLAAKTSGPALFRAGVYMLSFDMVKEVDQQLLKDLAERENVLVPAFLDVYDAHVVAGKARLKDLASADDYPARSEVAASFTASMRYFTLGEAQGLGKISADIFQREQQKAEAQWSSVLEESRDVLRAELLEMVDHMVDRLTPDETGKKKRFNSSMVDNLDDFLATFGKRSIANDPEMQAVVTEARKALAGITPDRLRDNRFEREATRERFTNIKAQLDRFVVAKGRSYNLDGE